MLKGILAVSIGGSIGCLLRWQLSERLNALLPNLALGTLAANLIGGYVVGLAIGCLSTVTDLAPEWRLLIITGFCGGLTTFSSFSAETVLLLQQGRNGWALGTIAIHLFGSLLMTWAGLATWQFVQAR